jgi:26S proteasome regulatory subunit N8
MLQAIFYLDHNYLESMFHMFRKVNAKERIVGFYSTGPQIRSNDLRIYDIVERYTSGKNHSNPNGGTVKSSSLSSSLPTYPAVFSIIDVRPDRSDLPVTSYTVTEQINTLNTTTSSNKRPQRTIERVFVHVPTTLGAVEAEEVGVEHLLRDIHDPTISTIASMIQEKVVGLQTLHSKLLVCQQYIQSCISQSTTTTNADGTTTTTTTNAKSVAQINPTILSNLQTIISLLPNTIAITDQLHHRSMMQQTNDMYMSMYIAALIRTVMAIHDLINNQIKYGTDGGSSNTDTEFDTDVAVVTTKESNEKNPSISQEEKKE